MNDRTLEQELETFDFSLCHPVRENLLNRLLIMHRRDNATSDKWMGRMTDEELDWAAAAGTPNQWNCDSRPRGKE